MKIAATVPGTAFFALVLFVFDLWYRWDQLAPLKVQHIYVYLALFFLLLFVRSLGSLTRVAWIDGVLKVALALSFGLIWGIQYGHYRLYQDVVGPMEMGIVLGNLDYWFSHFGEMFSADDIWYSPLFVLLFGLFLFGVVDKVLGLPQRRPQGVGKALLTGTAMGLIGLVGMGGTLKVITHEDARPLLTPELAGVFHLRDYLRNVEEYRHRVFAEVYPERRIEPIVARGLRGPFNVLLIMHESTRADHASLYGYERDTMPYQKVFFKDSYIFRQAVVSAGSTRSSLEATFTGLDRSHGRLKLKYSSLLWHYTHAAGVRNFYISSHHLEWRNMGRAFIDSDVIDVVDDSPEERNDLDTARRVSEELEKLAAAGKPFFGTFHPRNPHYPYSWRYSRDSGTQMWSPIRKKGFSRKTVQETINTYNNAILTSDRATEIVLTRLQELGLDRNTLIIMASDHGEAFNEHGRFGHGKEFWQGGIHVPLVIHIPDELRHYFTAEELHNLEANLARFVSTADIFPTVLDILNVEPGSREFAGVSLLRRYPRRWLTFVYNYDARFTVIDSYTGDKYVVDRARKNVIYVNLVDDPLEQRPIVIPLPHTVDKQQFLEMVDTLKPQRVAALAIQ